MNGRSGIKLSLGAVTVLALTWAAFGQGETGHTPSATDPATTLPGEVGPSSAIAEQCWVDPACSFVVD